ncbi:MAG: hypothetical protein LBI27_01925, partial [Clostridiales bacterium]|nr:hypothetical protein [Clostridiales bacterium]
KGKYYDIKALVRYRSGELIYIGATHDGELLETPDGAVWHSSHVVAPGELEKIFIKWSSDIASVAISSFSALENGTGSFSQFGAFVRIHNGEQIVEIHAANKGANPRSYTLCFCEVIFDKKPNIFDVSNLESYSKPSSEKRIGYEGTRVVMDAGPQGLPK